MRIGTLRAIAHNIADSLGSGCGLLIGVFDLNVYGEAKKSPGGVIAIEFLAAKVTQGKVSRTLASAIAKYRAALPKLCAKHGTSVADFKTLTARYSGDPFDRRVIVTVRDRFGRCYVDEYVGIPARHIKMTDHFWAVFERNVEEPGASRMCPSRRTRKALLSSTLHMNAHKTPRIVYLAPAPMQGS